jgi:hypothetical protein
MRRPGPPKNSRSAGRTPPPSKLPIGRRRTDELTPQTSVRLTRKYADVIDGVDLRDAEVGDELRLAPHDADVLIAEGWAEYSQQFDGPQPRMLAADKAARPRRRRP